MSAELFILIQSYRISISLSSVYLCHVTQIRIETDFEQGIIDPAGTETFPKEPKFAKLLRDVKSMLVQCY